MKDTTAAIIVETPRVAAPKVREPALGMVGDRCQTWQSSVNFCLLKFSISLQSLDSTALSRSAAITLGSGNSLGPEAPAATLGL